MARFIMHGVHWPAATKSLRPWHGAVEVRMGDKSFEFVPVDVIYCSDHAQVLHCCVTRRALPSKCTNVPATVREKTEKTEKVAAVTWQVCGVRN